MSKYSPRFGDTCGEGPRLSALIVQIVNIAIWMGVGLPWWKVLGLW